MNFQPIPAALMKWRNRAAALTNTFKQIRPDILIFSWRWWAELTWYLGLPGKVKSSLSFPVSLLLQDALQVLPSWTLHITPLWSSRRQAVHLGVKMQRDEAEVDMQYPGSVMGRSGPRGCDAILCLILRGVEQSTCLCVSAKMLLDFVWTIWDDPEHNSYM